MLYFVLTLALPVQPVVAQDNQDDVIQLDITTIKGNTELPKYMYVVPWQDQQSQTTSDHKLVLYNLYADVFDPALPDYIAPPDYQLIEPPAEE